MAHYECIVQAGCTTPTLRNELTNDLEGLDEWAFGDASDVTVTFFEVPAGAGFTGGDPSHTSIMRVQTPLGCDYETRHELMSQICARWYHRVGCAREELLIFTSDRPFGVRD